MLKGWVFKILLSLLLISLHGKVIAENFRQGSRIINVSLGSGSCFRDDCLIIGGGIGYFPIDALELAFDAKAWVGGESSIYEVTPSITYIVNQIESFKPYAGVLYQKTFIEDNEVLTAYGGRAGFILHSQGGSYTRAGVVYLEYEQCYFIQSNSCSETYPELTVGIYF